MSYHYNYIRIINKIIYYLIYYLIYYCYRYNNELSPEIRLSKSLYLVIGLHEGKCVYCK